MMRAAERMMREAAALLPLRRGKLWVRVLLFWAATGSLAGPSFAQRGPGGPGGPGRPPGMPPGQQSMGPQNGPPPGPRPNAGESTQSTESTLEAGLQLGPPGRWWNDKQFSRSIGLDSKQQQRLNEVFDANKGTLLTLYSKLKAEESELEKATRARVLDERQIDQHIDRVVEARGELEKADAHMLLQIRSEMTAEQIAHLEEHRPPPE